MKYRFNLPRYPLGTISSKRGLHLIGGVCLLCLMLIVPAEAQDVYLGQVDGLVGQNAIMVDSPVVFHIYIDNTQIGAITSLSHGFHVYSPQGNLSHTTCGEWNIGIDWPRWFDGGTFIEPPGGCGDTIGFHGVALIQGGIPPGVHDVFHITTEIDATEVGKTFCLDSAFFPPAGTWMWSTPIGPWLPSWDGPHCFDIVGPPCLASSSMYHAGPPMYAWTIPNGWDISVFGTRFTAPQSGCCTLHTVNVRLSGEYVVGSPDMTVRVYDDDGFGMPGTELGNTTIPYEDLPTSGMPYVAADLSALNLAFCNDQDFHVGVEVVGGSGDTLNVISDDGSGSIDRSWGRFQGTFQSIQNLFGDAYVYDIELDVCWDCCNHDGNRGDVNYDGPWNVEDVVFFVAYLFEGGPEPPCRYEANVDGDPDEEVNVSDLTWLVEYLFTGGPPPPDCP